MSTNIAIKQFDDSSNNKIAGWTPWQAVYDDSGTTLDIILKDCQPDTIKKNINSGVTQINDATTEGINQVNKAASAYTNSLDDIYECLFPTKLEWGVQCQSDMTSTKVNFKVTGVKDRTTHKYEEFSVDKVTLSKRYGNEGEYTEQWSKTGSATGETATTITDNIEQYKLVVTNKGKDLFEQYKTFYMGAHGASNVTTMTKDVFGSFTKDFKTWAGGSMTITTQNNQYIWIIVPSTLNINKVTSSGFDVPMASPQTFTISDGTEGSTYYNGTYKAYRSQNALAASTWNLTVS